MITSTIIGKEIAYQLGVSEDRGQHAVRVFIEMIEEELARGEDVLVRGFGRFSLRKRAAHEGRNPQTGEKIAIAASVRVTFRPAQALKAALNPAPVRKVGGQRNSPMPQRKRA